MRKYRMTTRSYDFWVGNYFQLLFRLDNMNDIEFLTTSSSASGPVKLFGALSLMSVKLCLLANGSHVENSMRRCHVIVGLVQALV